MSMLLNIPNILTLGRILAVPLFLSLLVEGEHDAALIIFFLAGLTDGIDGLIARMYDLRTELGAHLDPLADKLLVVSAFIALTIGGDMPRPLMIVVLTRDVVILGGYLLTAAVVGTPMKWPRRFRGSSRPSPSCFQSRWCFSVSQNGGPLRDSFCWVCSG
jgi:cardiolipin synthase